MPASARPDRLQESVGEPAVFGVRTSLAFFGSLVQTTKALITEHPSKRRV